MAAGVIVLGAVLVLATVGGLAWRRRDGRMRESQVPRLTEADLGQPLGPRGQVTRQASGLPRRADVVAALALVTGETAS